jgi:hypothetical protein
LAWGRFLDLGEGVVMMVKAVVAALLAFAAVVAATSPASAQETSAQGGQFAPQEGSKAPRDEGSLYRGAYEVTEDGALVYGGDVVYGCGGLVALGAPAKPGGEDVTEDGAVVEPLTREAVELCAEAGFPPAGAILKAPASSNASSSAPDAAGGPDEGQPDDALPGTGGPDPLALTLAALASSAAGATLALRAKRYLRAKR